MPTTIQVNEETLDLLRQMRKSTHATSYDGLIRSLMKRSDIPHNSYYGFLGKKTMKHVLKGLRDKNDRI